MVAILVTRPAGAADPLVAALESRGHRVHAVPTVATEPLADASGLDAALGRLGTDDWLVLTSATGVRVVADRLRSLRHTGDLPRTAAIGPGTARAIVAAGLRQPIQPDAADGAALAAALLREGPIRGRRVLLARADAAAADLPEALRRAGAEVEDVVAYRTVEGPPESHEMLVEALADPDLRVVVVASGSAVRGLVRLVEGTAVEGTAVASRLRDLRCVTIGPRTTAAARTAGLTVAAEAASPSVSDLMAAVETLAPSATVPA